MKILHTKHQPNLPLRFSFLLNKMWLHENITNPVCKTTKQDLNIKISVTHLAISSKDTQMTMKLKTYKNPSLKTTKESTPPSLKMKVQLKKEPNESKNAERLYKEGKN